MTKNRAPINLSVEKMGVLFFFFLFFILLNKKRDTHFPAEKFMGVLFFFFFF